MTSRHRMNTRRPGGFTLIEILVTLVMVAIIAAMAVASYSGQVRKSRRVDAKTALLDLAGREERNLSATNAYSTVAANLGYQGNFPMVVGSGYYQVTVAVPDPNQPAPAAGQPPTYALTATPLGDQVNDTTCAVFTVNQLGQRTSVNNGGADSTTSCW